MAEPEQKPAHLEPSKLGTKEYWDNLYNRELTNHADNPADEGTVWFDDSDAENKIVSYLDESASSEFNLNPSTAKVLDLGCGNGSLLFALRDDGWEGQLLGVDYSEKSVELARQVGLARAAQDNNSDDGEQEKTKEEGVLGSVTFKVWDVLNGNLSDIASDPFPPIPAETEKEGQWDLVLDKGTFDAVSLSAERDSQGRRIFEGYGERVLRLLRTGGIFLVTSCNWTETELQKWFEGSNPSGPARLRMAGRIDYPSFSFGGVKGQTISTLCFEKVII
ncbi:protein-lysine N-methyltransferase EFM4 [Podospora australis]|uniref:Protein-lysine N-methyltransferase EFM4 n=1 Tax=Podospora australis TaxID=1536484 RepID=A0AAN7AM34_9PEZI|nr:protein-lysine N-methyltransferase EFM4 [Podospora australis]